MNQSKIEDNKVKFSECDCQFDIDGTAVKFCVDIHQKNHNINFNCPATYQMLGEGLTQGVFQLQSPLGTQWTKKVSPTEIEHISALGAILRPGCLESKSEDGTTITVRYERKKNGKMELNKYHPIVDNILKDTYGENIYQEESIELAKQCAGFSLQEGDALRKAAAKKLPEEMAKMKKLFLEKGKELGVFTEQQLEEIFNWIEASQRYSFNHSLVGNTLVNTYNGFKQINELKIGEMVLCPNDDFTKDEWCQVTNIYDHGCQNVYEIKLDRDSIVCTLAHKFLCGDNKVRPLRDLFGYFQINTLSGLQNIYSIEYYGNVPTYDIEVNNHHHLFYANSGIITSNSHALSYGLISYITAYIKCHFPLQFYKCWLSNEEKREEYSKLINEAKLFNINVYSPDLRDFKIDFYSKKGNIYFGLHNIKGLVKKDLQELAKVFAENNWSFSDLGRKITWIDFLRVGLEQVSSKTVEGLIHSGSLDFFGIDRARLYYDYERWNSLTPKEKNTQFTDCKNVLECIRTLILIMESDYEHDKTKYQEELTRRQSTGRIYKTIPKEPKENRRLEKLREIYQELAEPIYNIVDTVDSVIFSEENLLGVALTKHKTDEIIVAAETGNCLEIANGRKDYTVLRVKIDQANTWKCKNGASAGKPMCFLKISDKSSQIDAVAFPDCYEQYQHLLVRGNLVFISGSKDKDSFIIKRVYNIV